MLAAAPCMSTPEADGDTYESADDPIHDVAQVLDLPVRSLHFSHTRDQPGGVAPSIAFLVQLPGTVLLSQLLDPCSLHKVLVAPDANDWCDAMDCEMENLHAHDVYELVPRVSGAHTIRLSWVLHWKFQNSTFDKNKVRLVTRGNHQRPGIDYDESFAWVIRLKSLRTLLALAASNNLEIVQFDITSAYLHSDHDGGHIHQAKYVSPHYV